MHLFGLIGYPLSHSLSREYFLDRFKNEGLEDVDYQLFPIKSIDKLPALLRQHPNLVGFNVTSPYKQAVIPYLQYLSPEAEQIGSVNVVKVQNVNGGFSLKGYNTDYIGFKESLRALDLSAVRTTLVLGTGGAAKAVAFALSELGIACHFVSRSPCNDNELSYAQLTSDLLSSHQLIINATPVGMQGVGGELPFPYELLSSNHILYDLIYAPAETEFLRQGCLHGCATKNGLEMLYLQADASWRIWNE